MQKECLGKDLGMIESFGGIGVVSMKRSRKMVNGQGGAWSERFCQQD